MRRLLAAAVAGAHHTNRAPRSEVHAAGAPPWAPPDGGQGEVGVAQGSYLVLVVGVAAHKSPLPRDGQRATLPWQSGIEEEYKCYRRMRCRRSWRN